MLQCVKLSAPPPHPPLPLHRQALVLHGQNLRARLDLDSPAQLELGQLLARWLEHMRLIT